jgi:peptidoglycan/xylan/chitin deacetylase (PgdA/CDA1 family)
MNLLATGLAGAAAGAAASLRWNWWRRPVRGIPTLMYHKIGVPPRGTRYPSIWAGEAEFRAQLDYLRRRGYATLRFADFRDMELGRAPLPERPAFVTFDDGFANNYELALPILKEFGMKANIFLVCGRVGGDSSWDSAGETAAPIPMLTWAQIREMQDSGVFEFGSHTMNHVDLLKTSPDEIRRELSDSKKILEDRLGREALGFAYPWGQGADDPAVRALVRAAGYRYDFGTRPGITPLPWDPASGALMRVEPVRGTSALDFHLKMTRGRAWSSRRFWE